jgi:hypothetical protein
MEISGYGFRGTDLCVRTYKSPAWVAMPRRGQPQTYVRKNGTCVSDSQSSMLKRTLSKLHVARKLRNPTIHLAAAFSSVLAWISCASMLLTFDHVQSVPRDPYVRVRFPGIGLTAIPGPYVRSPPHDFCIRMQKSPMPYAQIASLCMQKSSMWFPSWRYWHQPACPRHHLFLWPHPGQRCQPHHKLQSPERKPLAST